jgi:creatinine amidohydrolase
MMSLHQYGTMTWPEVEEVDRSRAVVLLPMGSVEQHGHHGPLTTDTIVSLRLCKPLADAVPELTWLELPPLIYGYAKHSAIFPGTISIEATTLSLLVRDVLRGVLSQGFRNVVMLNSHYENAEFAIDGAAQALDGVSGAKALMMMWWEFIPDPVIAEVFGADWRGWLYEHAGLTETSLMLRCAPEVVRTDRVREDTSTPSAYRFRILPWERANFAESGSTLGAKGCSAERGALLLDHFVKGAAALVRDQFSTR